MVNRIFEYGSLQWIFQLDKIIHVLARVVFKCLQGRLVQAETSANKDIRDLKDKRDKRGRGCLESVTCAGAGQGVREMVKLCTQVSALYREKLKLSKVQDYDTCRFPYIIPVVSINLRKKSYTCKINHFSFLYYSPTQTKAIFSRVPLDWSKVLTKRVFELH